MPSTDARFAAFDSDQRGGELIGFNHHRPREEPFARAIDRNVQLQGTSTSKLHRRRPESGKRSITLPNVRLPSVGVRFHFRRYNRLSSIARRSLM